MATITASTPNSDGWMWIGPNWIHRWVSPLLAAPDPAATCLPIANTASKESTTSP